MPVARRRRNADERIPTWWRVTLIICATAPLWLKALAFAQHHWLLPMILAVGAASVLWFVWAGGLLLFFLAA